MTTRHVSVLYQEVVDALRPKPGGRYLDCTLGAGGHAAAILEAAGEGARLLGLDADPEALALARERLEPFGERARLVNANFRYLVETAREEGFVPLDGVLMDLGLSSMQLDIFSRGFSFRRDGPLDMRFDPRQTVTAADIVNGADELELRKMLYEYGEERHAPRIVRAIVQERSRRRIETTSHLVETVSRVLGPRREGINSATKTFQALRIAVNGELDSLRSALPQALDVLAMGGRLAVISFHSLEDRIVKGFMRHEASDCICPPGLPVCVCGKQPSVRLISRKPIVAMADEVAANPRARSAKLRVAEKIV